MVIYELASTCKGSKEIMLPCSSRFVRVEIRIFIGSWVIFRLFYFCQSHARHIFQIAPSHATRRHNHPIDTQSQPKDIHQARKFGMQCGPAFELVEGVARVIAAQLTDTFADKSRFCTRYRPVSTIIKFKEKTYKLEINILFI